MGKLEGKVAVVTGGSSGMALASAKVFVEEGAYVFITGRKQEQIDEAVRGIGRNVTGVQGDAANLDDLDRLFDIVKRKKGKIDILFASAGIGEPVPLGQITAEHFDKTFDLNVRGTLFTVQKALPLFNDGGSIFMTGSNAAESVLTPEARQYFESLIPRGTMGQSEEVATVALFLASGDSSFVNGQELFVDGGMTAI